MRASQVVHARTALAAALLAWLLPGSAALAQDTDLFRTNVPPNILLLVDNSSSMANQVWHKDYGRQIVDIDGNEKKAKNQTECTFFRDRLGSNKFSVNVEPRRSSYQDPDGVTMRWRPEANLKSWEIIPILDPYGNRMFDDLDLDGVQDAGEDAMFYRFPDPEEADAAWLVDTGNEALPIKDVWGNHLFWDQDGDGVQDAGERLLYYDWNAVKNKPRGKGAKIVTKISPVAPAISAGLDLLTLEFVNDIDPCGIDTAGWSLWDGNDPLAAAPSGVVMKFEPAYLDWLFSSFGADAREPSFAPTVGNDGIRTKSSCVTLVGSEGPTYETYRRSRIQALTLILRTIICEVNQVGEVRFGFAQFRFGGKGGDDNGGYVAVPLDDFNEDDGSPNTYSLHGITSSHENHLRRVIRTAAPDAQTPLAEALFQIYTYFMPRTVADLPNGRDWEGNDTGVRFPVYNYDTSLYDPLAGYDADEDDYPPNLDQVGGLYVGPVPLDPDADASGDAAPDPVLYPCQKNFVLYITDGFSSGDDFTDNDDKINAHFSPVPPVETHTDIGYSDFLDLIGDHYRNDDGSPDETETTAGTGTKYLDDVAYFMNRWDFRPDMDGDQTIDIYTVGFSLDSEDGGEDTNLQKAAIRGNGEYFESSDADQLADDIIAAITDMIDKAQAFTSATVPASRTTDGNNFYSSFFLPKADSGFWEGHLKNFDFSPAGEILTSDGRCATGNDIDAQPPCGGGGALRTFEEQVFWDTADEMPHPDSRKLYVELGATSMFSQPARIRKPVTVAEQAAAVAALGIVDGVDELDAPYDSLSPNEPEDIAVAIIENVKGCEFGSDPCVPRTNDAGDKIYLGDIFHSNPVVVGSPNAPLNEPSYQLFANQYRERERVIYAGGNDGFLHGFHAGTWRTTDPVTSLPLQPPRHDRGTGEELMGFMPYPVRQVIKELPKVDSFPRPFELVDGSPIAADVWFYRNAVSGSLTNVNPLLTPDDTEPARWRTVVVGGLRDGGQAYYAIDVTDPPAAASSVTSTYPRYLWGFPCEDCANAVNPNSASEASYLGYTWSEPVITRVRVAADGGSDPHGYDRWVAIFGAGYHPHGDPNGSDYREPSDAGFTPRGRGIYMVDITTGEVLAKKVFDDGAAALDSTRTPQVGVAEFQYAFASAPAVFDLDFDGYADVVYIGDLGGNLWKWVVKAVGDDPINNNAPNNDMAQPNWPFRRIFRAGTSLEPTLPGEQGIGSYDSDVHYQSFFFPPTGVLRSGKLMLAFGAGERANAKGPYSEYGDGDPTNNNHFYVVRDANPMEFGVADPDPIDDSLVEADLEDLDTSSATCSEMQATKDGFYITARDAEKFITNSVIFFGTVFTGSFLPPDPADSTDICNASGQAFIYAFDVDCGDGHFSTNPGSAADKRRKAIGSGIPTRPRVSVGDLNRGGGGGGGGCANRVVVITSDGYIDNDCPGSLPNSGVDVRSWRER